MSLTTKQAGRFWSEMSEPLDLNSFLTPILASGNTAQLNQLIRCNLNSNGILQAVVETKNYSALKALGAFLRYSECDRQLVQKMYMEAIADGTVSYMEIYIGNYFHAAIDRERISTECARKNIPAYKIPRDLFSEQAYCDTLVELDNLDLLLESFPGRIPHSARHKAGVHCSKKIMDYFGYSSENLIAYISGAFQGKNKDTLLLLAKHEQSTNAFFVTWRVVKNLAVTNSLRNA